jgi:hypothetical protein
VTITDAQLRTYLLSTGWAEHTETRGLWERLHPSGEIWALTTWPWGIAEEAAMGVAGFEGREVEAVCRDIGWTMPMAKGGVA